MDKEVEYKQSNIDWSKYVSLTDDQRKQLIREKLERYRIQSEKHHSLIAHARDYEQ
jgi:hypothetical protein